MPGVSVTRGPTDTRAFTGHGRVEALQAAIDAAAPAFIKSG